MKLPILSISSTLLVALLAFSAAAPAAPTDPVGYVSLGDTRFGQHAVKAHTDVMISVPLDMPTSFAGLVASVSGSQLTIAGNPGFGINQYATAGSPYIVKFEDGPRSGLNALITANGNNTLTIAVPAGDDLNAVLVGSPISVRPAWTVKRLLEGNTVPAGTQLLAYSGSVPGINIAADLAYEFNGVYWEDSFTLDVADATVLYTGEGFILRNPTATPIPSLVISGAVSTSASRVVLSKLSAAGQDNWISYVTPVTESIGSSGLSAVSYVGDQVLAFDNTQPGMNKSSTTIVEWNGEYWEDAFTSEDVSATFMFTGGEAYVFRRGIAAPLGDRVWSDVPSFVGGL